MSGSVESLEEGIAGLKDLLLKNELRQANTARHTNTEENMAEQTGNLTFGIIKPDAVRAGKTGAILQRITDAGFRLRALKLIHMTKPAAEGFYAVHRERPFFAELTTFMSRPPRSDERRVGKE